MKFQSGDCLLCGIPYFFEEKPSTGDFVKFSEYEEPLADTEPPFWQPAGLEYFCSEHIDAAKALTHMTSPEALLELQKQYGDFPEYQCSPLKFSWRYKLLSWRFGTKADKTQSSDCRLCAKPMMDEESRFNCELLTFAEYETPSQFSIIHPTGFAYFCGEHFAAAKALTHMHSEDAMAELHRQFGYPQYKTPALHYSWWDRLTSILLRFNRDCTK